MIEGASRGAWRELERELRPFVARRVSPAERGWRATLRVIVVVVVSGDER